MSCARAGAPRTACTSPTTASRTRSCRPRDAASSPPPSAPRTIRTSAFAYGAQAAEILLDAIARSDGTRPSVNRELRATRVEEGILGDIRFDKNGDLVEGPVTIYRFTRKGPTVDRVVTVRATGDG